MTRLRIDEAAVGEAEAQAGQPSRDPRRHPAWRICRQTTPKEIVGADKRAFRFPLETTAEVVDVCGFDVNECYLDQHSSSPTDALLDDEAWVDFDYAESDPWV